MNFFTSIGLIGIGLGFAWFLLKALSKNGLPSRRTGILVLVSFAFLMVGMAMSEPTAEEGFEQGIKDTKEKNEQISAANEKEQDTETDALDDKADTQSESMKTEQTSTTAEQQEKQSTEQIDSLEKEAEKEFIPGIAAADIKLLFENNGFFFGDINRKPNSDRYSQDGFKTDPTTEIEYSVSISAEIPESVRVITFRADGALASVSLPHNEYLKKAKEFLAFCATLPYEGSDPDKAKKWVENNIDKVKQGSPAETTIGPVRLRLAGDDYFYFMHVMPKELEE